MIKIEAFISIIFHKENKLESNLDFCNLYFFRYLTYIIVLRHTNVSHMKTCGRALLYICVLK